MATTVTDGTTARHLRNRNAIVGVGETEYIRRLQQRQGFSCSHRWRLQGVAVHKVSGRRTYMRMGRAGVNVGLGGQKYQVVFLFQDTRSYRTFVDTGWQADASANAVAGPAGVNADATFTNGVAVFQLTEGGLMLQADISGTKYWRSKRLNEG